MPQQVAMWNAFNAGELSPLLDGRTDQEKYFSGAKQLRNFIPTVQGPAIRRGGTRYLGTTKNAGSRAWLVPFEFSVQQSYVLEFGDLYVRFWVNRGQLLNLGVPLEIVSPWSAAALTSSEGTFNLRFVQSGDVMWIVDNTGLIPPYKLQRLGATNWTLTPAPLDNGPFKDVNPAQTITVSASAETGSVTLTASSSIFSASLIGSSIYLETQDPSAVVPWRPGTAYAASAVVRYEGNVYRTTAGGTSGTYPPVHFRGDFNDGAVTWTYLHSARGWAKITAVASGTSATATVTSRLPAQVTGAANTTRWALSEFNAVDGWPTGVTFFRERLVYTRSRKFCLSVVGDYDNFARFDGAETTTETAIIFTAASDRVDAVRWITSGSDLLYGTARAEGRVGEQTPQKVFAADNIKNTPETEYGARRLPPIRIGSAILFVQRSGRTLRELKYDYAIDKYKADDLTVLAPHITKPGIVDMDFALEPDSLLWCVLGDGTLAALTYNRERGVVGWTLHTIGGTNVVVESVCSIPQPDLKRDDVWLIVRRTVNGATVRYVEVMEGYDLAESDVRLGWFLDCAIQYNGAPATTITGLAHLEGATVGVLVDGTPHADCVVTGGQITLNRSGSIVLVGYNFASILQTMRPDGGAQDGAGQTRRRSISEVWVRFDKTIGGKVGPNLSRLDPIAYLAPSAPIGTARPLYTGDKRVAFPAQNDTDGYVFVVQDQALPMTVVAIMPRMSVDD